LNVISRELLERLAAKQAGLVRLVPRAPGGLANRDHSREVELTYTSNAIEGNTLTAAETTLAIEQGITVGGKTLSEHMETIDHYEAIRCVRAGAGEALHDRDGCA
jgi:Fic family protein